jgi:hypothetical protein
MIAHMQSHRHIALDASGRLAARCALYLWRITAAVLKKDNLLIIRQCLADSIYQRIAEMAVHLFAFVLTT